VTLGPVVREPPPHTLKRVDGASLAIAHPQKEPTIAARQVRHPRLRSLGGGRICLGQRHEFGPKIQGGASREINVALGTIVMSRAIRKRPR
jgi:hypothetical protein